MADLTYDGMLRVALAPTIANIASPTVAELTGASVVDLTPRLTPDGLALGSDTGSVDNTKMNSTANTMLVGRGSFTASVTYVLSTEDDLEGVKVRDALVYRAAGFLVVRRSIVYGTAFAAAQRVEVYPVQCGYPNPSAPGPDTMQTVEVPLMVTNTPRGVNNPATVAGP